MKIERIDGEETTFRLLVAMDALVGNMRNTLGNGVRKMFSVPQNKFIANDYIEGKMVKSQFTNGNVPSKYFGVLLKTICATENCFIPFLVRDICSYILKNALSLEGIFRISAPQRQITRLRELYEQNTNHIVDFLETVPDVDGHAAAGLIKHFLRQLPEPLIHDDVIHINQECKALSDNDFANRASIFLRTQSLSHQHTLKHLLRFLRIVMRNAENRMSAKGLSVVFGPNVFHISTSDNFLQAQNFANETFERLLSCSEMLTFADEDTPKPRRAPPPPIPQHIRIDARTNLPQHKAQIVEPTKTVSLENRNSKFTNGVSKKLSYDPPNLDSGETPPKIPLRTTSLLNSNEVYPVNTKTSPQRALSSSGDIGNTSTDSNYKEHTSSALSTSNDSTVQSIESSPTYNELSSTSFEHRNDDSAEHQSILEDSISVIVKKRLFSDSSSSSDNNEPIKPPEKTNPHIKKERTVFMKPVEVDEIKQENKIHDSVIEPTVKTTLLTSMTKDRISGPHNRRKPSSRRRLLTDVSFDSDSDSNTEVVRTPKPKPRQNVNTRAKSESELLVETTPTKVVRPELTKSKTLPTKVEHLTSIPHDIGTSNSVSTGVTTVTTPDSGCITEEIDIVQSAGPRTSSPVHDNYFYDDSTVTPIKRVYVPKLDLRNSLDEDENRKKSTNGDVPPLDLSDVIEGDFKPVPRKPRKSPPKRNDKTESPPRSTPQKHRKIRKKLESKSDTVKKSPEMKTVEPDDKASCSAPSSVEKYLKQMLQSLDDARHTSGRPYDVTKMTSDQVKEEKFAVQRELLKYETKFGRPSTKHIRDVMREVYDRYRTVKRLARQQEFPSSDTRTEESSGAEHLTPKNDDLFLVTNVLPKFVASAAKNPTIKGSDVSLDEMHHEVSELRARRRKIRKILRDFEASEHEQGRSPEKRIMKREYEEYKNLKIKIHLLEEAIRQREE